MSPRKHRPGDPTAAPTADQSTQSAGGLGIEPRDQGRRVAHERDAEDVLNRNREERYDTPRKYEEEDSTRQDG